MILILVIFTFVFAMNVVAFILYGLDKYRALMEGHRIPESVLYAVAIAGGAYGSGAAMMLFRHKTRHRSFLMVVPICIVVWMAILIVLCLH